MTLPGADAEFFYTFSAGVDRKKFEEWVRLGGEDAYSTPITYYPVTAAYAATWMGDGPGDLRHALGKSQNRHGQISAHDDRRGFPPGRSLGNARGKPGEGLGLPLVKAIAELHSGSLDLLDTGPGLTVRIRVGDGS